MVKVAEETNKIKASKHTWTLVFLTRSIEGKTFNGSAR